MQPGRELDALVWLILNGRPASDLLTCRYVDGDVQPHAGYGHISPAPYSTNILAAWMVVEWLAERGIVSVSSGHRSSFDCDFYQPSPDGRPEFLPAHVNGTTAPHAICLAVLEAVGVKESM